MLFPKLALMKNKASAVPNSPLYTGPTMPEFWGVSKFPSGKPKMVIIGHQGSGQTISTAYCTNKSPTMENTVPSGADFVQLDVQVTKDGHPVIFHDDVLIAGDEGLLTTKRVADITFEEFLAIGNRQKTGRTLLVRRPASGSIGRWSATMEDHLCSLPEAFKQIDPSVGFNLQLKFDDENQQISQPQLKRMVDAVVQSVRVHSKGRKVFYSTFHPDAAELLRKGQSTLPVFLITNGGSVLYNDPRKNSIEAAIEHCIKNELQGIVCEAGAIMNNPEYIMEVKKANLIILTYGDSNNEEGNVLKQAELGVEGVIVVQVPEVVTAIKREYTNN